VRCEVIAVGTELLLGQIVDTNSAWIGEQLALAGIDAHYQTRVGDNQQRIVTALRVALERADAVIVCGGLGPTQDDITRAAIAEVMGVEMEHDANVEIRIRERFAARGREMPRNNLRQAQIPVGGKPIPQMPGTAPGLQCPIGDQVIYAVPGVPWELREMVTGTIVADLRRRAGASTQIRSRILRTWGYSESKLAELLAPRITALESFGNPTIAFLASGIEGLKIRITAKAAEEHAAAALLGEEERQIRTILGDNIFGCDEQTMESVIIDLLRERGMTLAVAESLTGGLVATRITDVAGASDVFHGSLTAYASAVKFELLELPRGPVVTSQAAEAMAQGVRRLLGADVGLATTGVAGPSSQEGQQPGTVFIGLAWTQGVDSRCVRLAGSRRLIRELTVISLLDFLRRELIAAPDANG
jgi:nicotinamide-nucleotide amidase